MSEKKSKKKKQLVNKAKKIRSIVMMSLMCIMLLSAATYAWFSLSNAAKMTNLTMTVGSGKGLQVALVPGSGNSADCEWKSSIEAPNVSGKLLPATYDTAGNFYEPEYDDYGVVTGVTTATKSLDKSSGTNDEGYYCTMTFYMRSQGTKSNVCLVGGILSSGKGTYVGKKTETDASVNAANAIRIAITANSTTKVYEPNNGVGDVSTAKAEVSSEYTPGGYDGITVAQGVDGKFGSNQDSVTIFTLEPNTATLVTLKIWIEGNDPQCGNEIQLGELVGQLQFKATEAS